MPSSKFTFRNPEFKNAWEADTTVLGIVKLRKETVFSNAAEPIVFKSEGNSK